MVFQVSFGVLVKISKNSAIKKYSSYLIYLNITLLLSLTIFDFEDVNDL